MSDLARRQRAALIRGRLGGVAFLVIVSLLVGLTVLIYRKTFVSSDTIYLRTSAIGNQLSPPADVKLRGVLVGEVRKVSSEGDGATLQLAIKPDMLKSIPGNVTAQLLPKTLFGEKYVALQYPTQPQGSLRAGETLAQDRTQVARETEQALNDLFPVLKALKPAQLSTTLNAVSTALDGRGNEIGANLVTLDAYLKKFNPALPQLKNDNQLLADVSRIYSAATPDVLTTLDNLSFSSRSLVDQQSALNGLLTSTNGFAGTADGILRQNEQKLITLATTSVNFLRTYAKYAPNVPCTLAGLKKFQPLVSNTFGGKQPGLHITLETSKNNGGYSNGQQPKYLDTRAPDCFGLPDPKRPAADVNFKDGYKDGLPGNDTTSASSTASARQAQLLAESAGEFVPVTPDGLLALGDQTTLLKTVTAPLLGVPEDQVPDVMALLLGPIAQGTTIGLDGPGLSSLTPTGEVAPR